MTVLSVLIFAMAGCGREDVESVSPATIIHREDGISGPFDCLLECVQTTDSIVARVHIRNVSGAPARIVKHDLAPGGRLSSSLFDVSKGGESVVYRGLNVNFGAPTASDYVNLGDGEEVQFEVDLNRYYDMQDAGDYEVCYRVYTSDIVTNQLIQIESNTAVVTRGQK